MSDNIEDKLIEDELIEDNHINLYITPSESSNTILENDENETNPETNLETNLETNPETDPSINLSLDYMISLKLYLESEFNHLESDSNIYIIKYIYNYLHDLNVSDDKIKEGILLLFENDNNKEEIEYIFNRIISRRYESNLNRINYNNYFTNIFSIINNTTNIVNEIRNEATDEYTGDIIDPTMVLDLINTNLNNFNNNFTITFYTNDQQNFQDPLVQEDVKNIATEDILNKNTTVDLYKNIHIDLRKKHTTCSICIDDFNEESNIRIIKCKHIFHKDCIDPWLLKESYKCPVCRDDTLPHEHNTEKCQS